ncbi:MAG TPA: STAS domain-containing protein [Tepidisphaeraceae bacterium]|nr:STAS domain-containing protein [Tepidisphaeraceae bacterium]
MLSRDFAIAPKTRCFAHREAYGVWKDILRLNPAETIVLDLSSVDDVTTSAFARLVLLRRELRRNGGDLRLAGLHDRAEQVYKFNRLDDVLPRC